MTVLLLIIITLICAKYAGRGRFFTDNFSLADTRAQKGFFAIAVILHHLCTYLSDAFPSLFLFKHAGFLAVGGFFLISGYGLQYGVSRKDDYLRGFFRKRLLAILLPYYVINMFYIASRYISGALTKRYIVMSLFGMNLWYVTAICVLYIGFWLSYRLFGKDKGKYAITVFVGIYILALLTVNKVFGNAEFGYWWYNSVICFALGIWYCDKKEKIDRALQGGYWVKLAVCGVLFLMSYRSAAVAADPTSLWVLADQILCAILFAVLVIMLSMKVRIGNSVLDICGDLSFELYLFHAILILFFRSGISIGSYVIHLASPDLYLAAILVGTFAMSVAVHWACGKVLKVIRK